MKLIKHPDIIEYYESFLSLDNIYIVMEYASKGDFAKVIKFTCRLSSNAGKRKNPLLSNSFGKFLPR